MSVVDETGDMSTIPFPLIGQSLAFIYFEFYGFDG